MEYAGLLIVILYLVIINLVAVGMTISDKKRAQGGKWRISERNLLVVSALGGSLAMYLTMKKIRHKTQHKKFMIGIPVIMAIQVFLIILFIVISI